MKSMTIIVPLISIIMVTNGYIMVNQNHANNLWYRRPRFYPMGNVFIQTQHQAQPLRPAFYVQSSSPTSSSHPHPHPHHQRPQFHNIWEVGRPIQYQITKRYDNSPIEVTQTTTCPHQLQLQLQPQPSQQYPVYVLPPKNFQPIIYQHPQTNYLYSSSPSPAIKSSEEMWYQMDNIDDSFHVKIPLTSTTTTTTSTSGKSEINNNIINNNERRKPNIIYVPINDRSEPITIPILEAYGSSSSSSLPKTKIFDQVGINRSKGSKVIVDHELNGRIHGTNPYNTKIESSQPQPTMEQQSNGQYKTKLPVGLSSFLFGGVRGISARHWTLDPQLIRHLEFMPNIDPMSPENKYLPESTYVKMVTEQHHETSSQHDNLPLIPGEPEKEEPTILTNHNNNNNNIIKHTKFGSNTIIDSALDLEAQESVAQPKIIEQTEMVKGRNAF
ncbi:hypothetical protein BLOT_010486 [Blomia tropicalis]|nr:hypothetical protein BLOT_010486 [Blomia tropicalis]